MTNSWNVRRGLALLPAEETVAKVMKSEHADRLEAHDMTLSPMWNAMDNYHADLRYSVTVPGPRELVPSV